MLLMMSGFTFADCLQRCYSVWVTWAALVTILLTLPSVFAQLELNYELDEEVQSGTLVADIFRDAQLQSEYNEEALSVIHLRFLKDDLSNFTITNRTGIIRTRGRIDREAVCPNQVRCLMRLDVAIQPNQYFKIIKVTLEIRDINDNPPRFSQPVITHSILESALPGQAGFVIPTPIDQDSPPLSISRYDLQPRTGPFKLSITSKVDGSQEIQLILNSTLDREQEHLFTFRLIAYDGGSPPNYGTVELQINILDANDNHPAFDQPSYEVSIPENIAQHTPIIQVHASDPDMGSNGEIIYSFSETTHANYGRLFGIDNKTGDVFVMDTIDYESSHIYHLSVTAQDKGPDSIPGDATLVVHIVDINDHAPEITINTLSPNPSDSAEVTENSPIDTFVAHITVNDKDSGSNAQFNCTLNDHHFRLQYLYDTEFQLVTSVFLDREEQEFYSVTLTCRDHGSEPQIAVKTIPIQVKDINDHSPVFGQDTYSGEVIENNYRGVYVTRVNATDNDLGDNGKVTYSIPTEFQQYFSIEPSTGVIRAQTAIDREVVDQLRFYVTATDHGKPPMSSSALVIVDVQDVNDKPPVFKPKKEFTFAVFENEPAGTAVGQVTAEDADSVLYNTVSYSFLPSHTTDAFIINESTGEISTSKMLDRESQPMFYLEVLAKDKGSPPLSGTASVTVYISDRNDNAPIFDYPSDFNNTIYVSNQVPQGYVITRVTAHDLDIGSNSKIIYEIDSGNSEGMFDMDPVHGTLIVSEDLNHITSKVFDLSIVAKDDGEPQNVAFSHMNLVVNKSVPFPPMEHKGPLLGQNFTIVITVACVSALVIVVLVIAIVCLKRQDVDRQARKYNCRMQALRIATKESEMQKTDTKGVTGNPWIQSETLHSKCNGTSTSISRDNHHTVVPDHIMMSRDSNKFSSKGHCTDDSPNPKTPLKSNNKDTAQKIWPTMCNPDKMQTFSSPRDHYTPNNKYEPTSSVDLSSMATTSISTFNPHHPPVGIVAPSTQHPGCHGNTVPQMDYPHGYPPYNDREVLPVSVEKWRQNINNRRELQVHQVLDLLKNKPIFQPVDTESVDSGQSSNTDSGCIPSEEGEHAHRHGGYHHPGSGYVHNNTGLSSFYAPKHTDHQRTPHTDRYHNQHDQWRGILT